MNGPGRLSPVSVVALVAPLVLLVASAARKIWGADFWWQHAVGRLVTEQGIPHQDVFSYTAPGAPWIEMRWLYCAALFHAVRWIGFDGLVVVKCLALLAAFGLVSLAGASRRTATLSAGVLTVAILASSQRFFLRPELVTYVLFALFLWIIDRFRSGRHARLLFVLPVLQVLWTNAHTLFVFGPLLTGLLALVTAGERVIRPAPGKTERREQRRRATTAAIVFGLTALACLANPYGLRGALFPLTLFEEIRGTAFKRAIPEFQGPFAFGHAFTAVTYFQVLVAICVASLLLGIRRLDPFWTILVASQMYLALLAIRNLPLFALAAIPFTVSALRACRLWDRDPIRRWLPRVEAAGAVAIVAVCTVYTWELATNRFYVRRHDTNQAGLGIASHRYPVAAVDFLEERGFDGRVFHPMREGAYLVERGVPVFIDPRLEVYGESRFVTYLNTVGGGPGWQGTLRRLGCQVALLDHGSSLVEPLLGSDGWKLVYFDEVSIVFARRDLEWPAIRTRQDFVDAADDVRRRLPEPPRGEQVGRFGRVVSPAPYKNVATFLVAAGHADLALPYFTDAVAAYTNDVDAYRSCASIHGALGNLAEATEMLEDGLRRWPGDPWMQRELGAHRFNARRFEEAEALAESSVRGDPTDPSAWELRAMVHAWRGDHERAVEAMSRAVALDPANVRYRASLRTYRERAAQAPAAPGGGS